MTFKHRHFTLSFRSRCMAIALILTCLATCLAILPAVPTAYAHGDVEVGDYALVIGFTTEPAYQGEPNGLDLRVNRVSDAAHSLTELGAETTAEGEAHEHDTAETIASDASTESNASTEPAATQPVEGLESTLQAELIFGASQKTLTIEPMWNQPGAYTAAVIPTEAGDYTWRIFGTIEGTPVDVSLTSSPDTFAAVETKAAVAFPEPEPAPGDLNAGIVALQSEATSLASANQTALLVGGFGVLLGLVALSVAIVAMRRKPV